MLENSMKLNKIVAAATFAVSSAVASFGFAAGVKVDPALPEYTPATGVSGNFSSIGSDTLNNLMTLWAEDFKRTYPNVNIQIQGAGSSTAPPALIESTANFGPMSREMKSSEIQKFEERHGYKPTAVPVAIDMLAVYVNKDNPIADKGMTLAQVDAIMSATRLCGGKEDITRWGQVGLDGSWAAMDIQMYGRNAVSGTYGFFKSKALCKGDYKPTVNEQPGSASVVQGVTESRNGIGYSGIGYITSGVKAIPLAKKEGGPFVAPTADNAGTYPLARYLLIYVNKHPNRDLDPIEREFFKMVLSQTGQRTVAKDGYIPLPAKLVSKVRSDLGL